MAARSGLARVVGLSSTLFNLAARVFCAFKGGVTCGTFALFGRRIVFSRKSNRALVSNGLNPCG